MVYLLVENRTFLFIVKGIQKFSFCVNLLVVINLLDWRFGYFKSVNLYSKIYGLLSSINEYSACLIWALNSAIIRSLQDEPQFGSVKIVNHSHTILLYQMFLSLFLSEYVWPYFCWEIVISQTTYSTSDFLIWIWCLSLFQMIIRESLPYISWIEFEKRIRFTLLKRGVSDLISFALAHQIDQSMVWYAVKLIQ